MELSENLWLFEVFSKAQFGDVINDSIFFSGVMARKLVYSKHVMRRNYSHENIGEVACHWLFESTRTLA